MLYHTSGTKEWAEVNLNIYKGCSEDCVYCYAKRMAKRFGRIQSVEQWKKMELQKHVYNGTIPKRNNGKMIEWFMFPSTHNITPENVEICLNYILRILHETIAKVLIVIKPHFEVVMKLCENLMSYKQRILFRFTITSCNSKLLKIYEPNAPDFMERFISLRYAFYHGFRTSVSVEPFLDQDPIPIIINIAPFVNDSIWLGIMSGAKYAYHTKENVKKICKKIKHFPENVKAKIRLKDSIRNKWGFELK